MVGLINVDDAVRVEKVEVPSASTKELRTAQRRFFCFILSRPKLRVAEMWPKIYLCLAISVFGRSSGFQRPSRDVVRSSSAVSYSQESQTIEKVKLTIPWLVRPQPAKEEDELWKSEFAN